MLKKTLYATIAKSATPVIHATSRSKVTPKTTTLENGKKAETQPLSNPKTKGNRKEPMQLVLITKKDNELPTYSAMAIRNAINKAITEHEKNIHSLVVGSVKTSSAGNIVLTTMIPHNAESLEKTKPLWKEVFQGFPIQSCQIQRPWIKLVAYGVPVEAEDVFE